MVPADFKQSNHVIDKPTCMDREECEPLCVEVGSLHIGDQGMRATAVQSCWKMTPEELDEVNRTGRVWLTVFGAGMPPVILSGHRLELHT